MEIIILSGAKGVGKTFLARKAQKKVKFDLFQVLNQMIKIAGLKYTKKDEKFILKKIFENEDFFTLLRRATIRKIQTLKSDKIVVETRFAMPEKFFLPELTTNELDQLSPKKIILIESDRETFRRNLSREVGRENFEEIVKRERNYSKFAAHHLKLRLNTIKNESINISIQKLVKAIK